MWQLLDFLVYSTVDSNVFEINDRFLRVLSFLHWSIQGKKAPINVKKAFEKVLYRCSRCQRSYFDRGTMQESALCPKCSDWKNTYVSVTEMSLSYKNVPFNCFESIKCVCFAELVAILIINKCTLWINSFRYFVFDSN